MADPDPWTQFDRFLLLYPILVAGIGALIWSYWHTIPALRLPKIGLTTWLGALWTEGKDLLTHKSLQPLPRIIFYPLIILGIIFAALFIAAILAAFALLNPTENSSGQGAIQSLGTGALILGLLSAPFVIWRSLVAQRTVNIAGQSHITDQINKAVLGLGSEKSVKKIVRKMRKGRWAEEVQETTEPNLEVRIGAIYALERIARLNLDEHVQIMEILTAYIRENAKASDAPALPECPEYDETDHDRWETALDNWKAEHAAALENIKPRADIQVTLTVIGRRDADQRQAEARWRGTNPAALFIFDNPAPDYGDLLKHVAPTETIPRFKSAMSSWSLSLVAYTGYRIDLRATNLCGADLTRLNLRGARFEKTQLQGANLSSAQLQGALFRQAQLQAAELGLAQLHGARLISAQLQGANLGAAHMQGAILRGAQLQGARLASAKLHGASLGDAQLQGARLVGAKLHGAYLAGAQLQRANIREAQFDEASTLTGANLRGAAVKEVDFTSVSQIKPFLPEILGDDSTKLPTDTARPNHWPKNRLVYFAFLREWRLWRANPTAYIPPQNR